MSAADAAYLLRRAADPTPPPWSHARARRAPCPPGKQAERHRALTSGMALTHVNDINVASMSLQDVARQIKAQPQVKMAFAAARIIKDKKDQENRKRSQAGMQSLNSRKTNMVENTYMKSLKADQKLHDK